MAGEAVLNRTKSLSVGSASITGRVTKPVNSPKAFKQLIPANSVNVQIKDPKCTIADNVCQAVGANKDCTLKTNSTADVAVPGTNDVLEITANNPLEWIEGDPITNKFLTANVANWYVTTGGEATLLTIIICDDATPTLSES